jgi:hypothetical protein
MPPADGGCHETVIVVVVAAELKRLPGWPGAAITEAAGGIAAKAIVPAE